MTINYYFVEIADGKGIISGKKEFKRETFNVIGENDGYLVIDNYSFTTIAKKKSYVDPELNKPAITSCTNDSVWGSRITYRLYTDRTKRADTIKREIEAHIKDKFGFFMGDFGLDFITDKSEETA